MSLLIELTLRGSLVLLAALAADLLWSGKMTARWRRVWWLLVPFAFLAPCSFPHPSLPLVVGYNGIAQSPVTGEITPTHGEFDLYKGIEIPAGPFATHGLSWLVLLWLAGAIVAALRILISTGRVQQQWKCERFCTDPALLNLLEDAKACAGINAPIGLIVSDRINAPALLGWLRPRILLPSHLASSCATELKAVLLHELAHFKSLDIPFNWLFALGRVIHWFNPLAYLASAAWSRFVEEAADESAIRWLHEPGATTYGEILLKTLGKCSGGSAPYGALAIGESIENLKRRIRMIRNYHSKTNRAWIAAAVVLLLATLMAASPTLTRAADIDPNTEKNDAVAAMQTWLGEMDTADYAKSWNDAAKMFQKAVPSDKWVAVSTVVRTPLGKLVSRKLDTTDYQSGQASVATGGLNGTFVIAQFDTSFENMKTARETVTFQKEDDGKWRAAGYYIKPQ